MQDIQEISEEHGLQEHPAELRDSGRLKEKLLYQFGVQNWKQTCAAVT